MLEAVAALGYKSNHMASSLRTGATRTVGIVVPNLGNEFYSGLVRQWELLASQSGFEMLVVASHTPGQSAQSIGFRRGRGRADDDLGGAGRL